MCPMQSREFLLRTFVRPRPSEKSESEKKLSQYPTLGIFLVYNAPQFVRVLASFSQEHLGGGCASCPVPRDGGLWCRA